jgi:hypothetical protein
MKPLTDRAQPPAKVKGFLYRVMENDDEGDPLDFGPVFAATRERAIELVRAHLIELGSFGWEEGGTLVVRIYDCNGMLAHVTKQREGVPASEGDYVDVTMTATICEECENDIPDVDGGSQTNRHHKASCSLYDADKE